MHSARNTYPSGCGERLKACGNIHALAEQVALFHHDVAQMHPDAEADLTILGQRLVGFPEDLLDPHSTWTAYPRAVVGPPSAPPSFPTMITWSEESQE